MAPSATPDRLLADLGTTFRPQRQWVEGRGVWLIVGHFLSSVSAGTWVFSLWLGYRPGLGLALATGELEIVEIDRRGNAQVALHGAAAERYGDLGGRRLQAATQPWPGGVLSWARLELGTEREQHALPSLGPLEGAREGRLGSTP